MAKFYRFFIKKFAFIMTPINNFMRKTTIYVDPKRLGILGVDKVEVHKNTFFISPNWDVEFHVHTYA